MTSPQVLGGAPPDLSADMDAALSAPDPVETTTSEQPVETTPEPSPEPQPEPEAAQEPEQQPEAQPAEAQPKPEEAKPVEELPEGVRERLVDGKRQMVLTPERYQTVYGKYKEARQIEDEILGEALTADGVRSLHQAFVDQNAMQTDFLSGDPQAEGRFLEHLLRVSEAARENGDVSHDPMMSIASRMPETLLARNEQAYYALRDGVLSTLLPAIQQAPPEAILSNNGTAAAIRDAMLPPLLDALLQKASVSQNRDLLLSVQHIQKNLYGQYTREEQIGQRPQVREDQALAAQRAELDRKQKQINDFYAKQETERWNARQTDTNTAIRTSISEEIEKGLTPIKDAYKDFPEAYQAFSEKLNSEIRQTLQKDADWQRLVDTLVRQARQSRSEERRQEICADIVRRYRARAERIVQAKAPTIVTQATRALKQRSDATHAQRASAAQRREPGTGAAPVNKSLLPNVTPNGGFASRDEIQAEMDALLR